MRDLTVLELLVSVLIASALVSSLLFLTVGFSGCTPTDSRARRAVEDQGFTNVTLGSHDWTGWGCPEEMDRNITFTARQPANGRQVAGIICCDTWGACTVRTR